MSKSLEALKNLKATAIETIRALSYPASNLVKEDIEYIEGQATTIEKDLKVLEILKKMPFKVLVYKDTIYRVHVDCKYLTTEESEKIIEWLEEKKDGNETD